MEKIFTEFVESMRRLYKNGMVQDKFVENSERKNQCGTQEGLKV